MSTSSFAPRQPSAWLFLALFALLASFSHASSLRPSPLQKIHHPRSLTIDITPRLSSDGLARRTAASSGSGQRFAKRKAASLNHRDWWRLLVEVDGREFALHMKPNEHLLHPSAFSSAPSSSSSSGSAPLYPHQVLAYEGHVFPLSHSPSRLLEDQASGLSRSDDEERAAGSLGWARLLVHDPEEGTMEGAFVVDGVVHHVLKAETYLRLKDDDEPSPEQGERLVIFRDGLDSAPSPPGGATMGCSHDHLDFNADPTHAVLQSNHNRVKEASPWWAEHSLAARLDLDVRPDRDLAFGKRDDVTGGMVGTSSNFSSTVGSTVGCPSVHRLVYTGVAADCAYVQKYGSTDAARMAILNDWNTASALYRQTFNISLGIVELAVMDSACPSSAASDNPWNVDCSALQLNDRLSAFSSWRGTQKKGDTAGLWHLMSGCATGQEVGVAWLGQLCVKTATNQGSQGTVSGTAVSTASRMEWQIVAHETGHNFGAIHDCTDGCTSSTSCCTLNANTCSAGGAFIMSPVSSSGEAAFSPCTVGNVCSVLGNRAVDSSCLAEPGSVTLISLQQCGNGIVEPGEDCDPGANSTSTCCDPTTCKFRANAVCDPSSSACCNATCGFASNGTVCRSSRGACDVVETCTGASAACPEDKTIADGTSCGGDGLACAAGICTSRDLQCSTVGASLNITSACSGASNSNTCQMTCNSPSSANSCLVLQSAFVDGSPCGFGGRCAAGECQAGNALNTATSWYRANLNIAIPVTVVVGIIVLLIIMAILRCCLRACYRTKDAPRPPPSRLAPPPLATGFVPYSGGAAAPPMAGVRGMPAGDRTSAGSNNSQTPLYPQAARQPQPSSWVDPAAYNGPGYGQPQQYQQQQQPYGQSDQGYYNYQQHRASYGR